MPSEKILKSKQKQVSDLVEKFKKGKIIIFTEYRGINVIDDTKLRSDLRTNNNEYIVVKNSIISNALKNMNIEGLDDILVGPTAVIIGYEDYVLPAKTVNEYIKDHDFYKFKAGIMDGCVITKDEITKLAKLPSKETLYSMLASALLGNIRNLAVVLDQVSKKNEVSA